MKALDTTFLIDLLNGQEETKQILQGKDPLFTTQINMYEIIRGLFLAHAPSSKIAQIIHLFEEIRVLPLNDAGIIQSAEISSQLIHKGVKIPDNDCLIAGILISHKINKIVTRNVSHFSRIPDLSVETY